MRIGLHGLQVCVTGPLPPALVGELLGGFPPGDPSARPDLTLILEPARGRVPAGLAPLYHYGPVQAFADGGDVVLTADGSWVRVEAGGARLRVAVQQDGLDPHRFQHLLVLLALLRALSTHGLFHLHAAGLVRGDGRSVLISGAGGSGKTTLALALLAQGLGYLGDDTLLLRAGQDRILSFPRPFHVAETSARPFPRLAPLLGPTYAGGPKRRLDPARAFPGAARAEAAAPALVLLPEIIAARRSEALAVDQAEAVGALLESSGLLAADPPEVARARVATLALAARGAACFRVRLGMDLLDTPFEALRSLDIPI